MGHPGWGTRPSRTEERFFAELRMTVNGSYEDGGVDGSGGLAYDFTMLAHQLGENGAI